MDQLKINPDPRLEPAPDPTAFDYALAAAKAGTLAFPFLGTGVTLFDLVTAPLRGKRMHDWCEELRLRLNDLSHKVSGLTPERLAQDEAFISTFAHASQAAMRNHQTEKLDALRNAVLNMAIGNAPAADMEQFFLTLVDSFTPVHLTILAYFEVHEPTALRPFTQQRDLADAAVRDLELRGLINDTRPYIARNRDVSGLLAEQPWHLSTLGKQFLAFIKAPPEENGL